VTVSVTVYVPGVGGDGLTHGRGVDDGSPAFNTGSPAPVSHTYSAAGNYTVTVSLQLSVTDTKRRGSVIAVSAPRKATKTTKKTVVVGAVSLSLRAGQTSAIQVRLNRTGQQLLTRFHKLTARLVATSVGKVVSSATVTFRAPKKK
jgi:PKD repeat protein